MKKLLLVATACFLSMLSIAKGPISKNITVKETPGKTVCIKHPNANNANFFSTITFLNFEVYKPDTKADIVTVVEKLSKDPQVQSCSVGKQVGDFYAIHLILKTPADKAWFIKAFKAAGLTAIKLNNAEVTEL
jgi:hypothetical protein